MKTSNDLTGHGGEETPISISNQGPSFHSLRNAFNAALLLVATACTPEYAQPTHQTRPDPETNTSPTLPTDTTPSLTTTFTPGTTPTTAASSTTETTSTNTFPDLTDKKNVVFIITDSTPVDQTFGGQSAPYGDATVSSMPILSDAMGKKAYAFKNVTTPDNWTGGSLTHTFSGAMPGQGLPVKGGKEEVEFFRWSYSGFSNLEKMPEIQTLIESFHDMDYQTCYLTENPILLEAGDKLLAGFDISKEYGVGELRTETIDTDCDINPDQPYLVVFQVMGIHGGWGNVGEPQSGFNTASGWVNCEDVEAPEGYDVETGQGLYNDGYAQLEYAIPQAFKQGELTLGDDTSRQLYHALACGADADARWVDANQVGPVLEKYHWGEEDTVVVVLSDHGDQMFIDNGAAWITESAYSSGLTYEASGAVTSGLIDHNKSSGTQGERKGLFAVFGGEAEAGVDERHVSSASGLPLVMEAMGMDVPTTASARPDLGHSVCNISCAETDAQVYCEDPATGVALVMNPLKGLEWEDTDGDGDEEVGLRAYKPELGIYVPFTAENGAYVLTAYEGEATSLTADLEKAAENYRPSCNP